MSASSPTTRYLRGGKILRVDLASGSIQIVPTGQYADGMTGGRGLSTQILSAETVVPPIDPLGPDNVLCLAAGPFSGTLFPAGGRTDVACLSPVAGGAARSGLGGDWAAELVQAGWDAVVLAGKAERPVYVAIRNERVEIRDAGELWGASNDRTRELIAAALDSPDAKMISIGPAGERLVCWATLHGSLGNALDGAGAGALMGSKNVKAVVVRGTGGIGVAEPEAFLTCCLELQRRARAASASVADDGGEHVAGRFLHDARREYGDKRSGCTGCPLPCLDNACAPEGGGTILSWEECRRLGVALRCEQPALWYRLARRCQRAGVDLASLVAVVEGLMRLHTEGMLPPRLTQGVPMELGSAAAIETIVETTIERTGIGDVVAAGTAALAAHLDARIPSARRGGASTARFFGPPEAGASANQEEDDAGAHADTGVATLFQMLGVCTASPAWPPSAVTVEDAARALTLGLGSPVSAGELLEAAARVNDLEAALDARTTGGGEG